MSEANAPFNPQGQPESVDSPHANLDESLTEVTKGANAPEQAGEALHLDINDIFDVSDLDEAALEESLEESLDLSAALDDVADAVTPQSQTMAASVPSNLSSIAAWSQEMVNQIEPPNLTDLVNLIQELNQCNGVLMDRVSQLEEALEYSQNALQAEVGRTQDTQSAYNVQDWTTVQEQITTLFNQLEFAHQTNQRQQILIETLTSQLENSQERAAQLEREAALIQQRYNEQAQQLAKSESTCRDLQSRLQRQQRYTLQFKAALEKCLEVPTPQYETPAASPEPAIALTEAPFLPKAQRIQPWSAQAHSAAKTPWMKLQHLDLPTEAPEPEAQPDTVQDASVQGSAAAQVNSLDLPTFGLSLLTSEENNLPVPPASVKQGDEEQASFNPDPALKQQLDEVVKPLADLLAEALLPNPVQPVVEAEQSVEATDAVQLPPSESSGSTAEELLASTMADAEDALWQDLARLIDVSTEDVVKASLSGDLAAFESIDFASLQADQAQTKADKTETAPPKESKVEFAHQPQSINAFEPSEVADTIAPLVRRIKQSANSQSVAQEEPLQESIPAMANASWPSPVVYPLRPTKKRNSLAMVDLPSFPRG